MRHDTRAPAPVALPRVLSAGQLRAHGFTPAQAAARVRPGGPWQALLPGVYLLHRSAATSQERLHGVLLYAGRPAVPSQGGTAPPYGTAMITGLAALALHQFAAAPPLLDLEHIDVLVDRTRRLRSTGCARIVRAQEMPEPVEVTGLPVAPVERAVADAVERLTDPGAVRALLTEAVRRGHCEPGAVVAELNRARLLDRPHVVDAVDRLLAEGRALAEERLYTLVREYGLPDPVWNVELRIPGGPRLGGVDAYWPDHAVAVELNTRAPRRDKDAGWSEHARKREHLERLGITVVHLTPHRLRESPEQQAMVVRTALTAACDREPAAYVVVLPR
ncbi:hypothetical protein GCM10010232_12250 [Streptomyces amakusaensis]|uniref:Transcriptional regulator, AbiEi antitoxin, Type IV TA system n=1 Tax=Streptomyces amakusaensis TaxID=67271 RepID=A0ABW0AED1_9ACTN